MAKKRSAAEVARAVAQIDRLITEKGMTQTAAAERVGLERKVYQNHIKKRAAMKPERRTSEEVLELAKKAHSLISRGMGTQEAIGRVGLADSVFSNALRRLNLARPPRGAQTGSIRADMLPQRPVGPGKGGKREPKPVDMNNVESLVKRLTKVNKLLHGVDDLKIERKKISARLRSLLKV